MNPIILSWITGYIIVFICCILVWVLTPDKKGIKLDEIDKDDDIDASDASEPTTTTWFQSSLNYKWIDNYVVNLKKM